MRDFDLLLEDVNTHQPLSGSDYLEELLQLESKGSNDLWKMNAMKSRIAKYFYKRTLMTLPFPADVEEHEIKFMKNMTEDR